MGFGITCRQLPKCDQPAEFRYTWPGKDESFVCREHAQKLAVVSGAIGLHLQLIPLTPAERGELHMPENPPASR